MNRSFRRRALIAVLTIALAAPLGGRSDAAPPTPTVLECDDTITTSIKLVNTVSCDQTIEVTGNNIVVDLGGSQVLGQHEGNGLDVTGTQVTVKNGVVGGFDTGINVTGDRVKLVNVTVTDNDEAGIALDPGSDRTKIINSTIVTNGGTGLLMDGSTNAVIKKTTIARSEEDGVVVGAGSDTTTFTNVTIAGNAQTGMVIDDSDGTKVTAATVVGNDSGGIRLDNGSDNTVLTRPKVVANSGAMAAGTGILIGDSDGTVIATPTVTGNVQHGIDIYNGSDNTKITGGSLSGNGRSGIRLNDAVNTTIKGVNSSSNDDQGIDVLGGSGNTLDTNVTNENGGYGIQSDVSAVSIVRNRADANGYFNGIDNDGLGISTHPDTPVPPAPALNTANRNGGIEQCLPVAQCKTPTDTTPPSLVTCSSELNATTTLANNIECAGDGPTVNASGLTINLGGHRFQGDGAGTGLRLDAGDSNTTVSNGVIDDFDDGGVGVDGANGVTVSRMIVRGGSAGIRLEGATGGTIADNTVTGASVGIDLANGSDSNRLLRNLATRNTDGLDLENSNSNTISRNRMIANAVDGVGLAGAESNTISSNVLIGNGNGIGLRAGSAGNAVQKNRLVANFSDGIVIHGSQTNTISSNFVAGSVVAWAGIHLWNEADSNTVTGNKVVNTQGYGILIHSAVFGVTPSVSNIVKRNKVFSNFNDGIFVGTGATGTVVMGNVVRGNGLSGIASAMSDTVVRKNKAIKNGFTTTDTDSFGISAPLAPIPPKAQRNIAKGNASNVPKNTPKTECNPQTLCK